MSNPAESLRNVDPPAARADADERAGDAGGAAAPPKKRAPAVRTAVVIVHGMGEQVPMETVNQFVRTALPRSGRPPERRYFSRPDQVAGSYEARRLVAYPQAFAPTADDPRVHDHFDFYEYHWSYKMTGNRLADFLPTLWRLLWRPPSLRPEGLRVVWLIVWGAILALFALFVWFLVANTVGGKDGKAEIDAAAWVAFVVGLVVGGPAAGLLASVVLWLAKTAGSKVTAYFVDVVRYLDRSPRSYAVRRDIRDGMVALLRGIHEQGTYQRVVVVAHSLGGYIAYDGLTSLWSEVHSAHCGPIVDGSEPPLEGRRDLERAGKRLKRAAEPYGWAAASPGLLDEVPEEVRAALDDYREKQFTLWKGMRKQGNPWLITDFITLGTPMYFADLLYTRDRDQFRELVRRAELPVCPPVARSRMVEPAAAPDREAYGYTHLGRWVLYHAAPFAVVRWTNLYFPAEHGFWGDWFGGPLRGLFGPGVLDVPVLGNTGTHADDAGPAGGRSTKRRNRRTPGLAHGYYFAFPEEGTFPEDGARPEDGEPGSDPSTLPRDIAPLLKRFIRLTIEDELRPLLASPRPLDATFPKPLPTRSPAP